MTPELEQSYQQILDDAPNSFKPDHNEYLMGQVDRIVNEPDAQKAAQMAYNLVSDLNHATVGQLACKALFDRDQVQGKNEATKLAAAVGNDLLRGQLTGELQGAGGFQVGAFARGTQGINGFNKEYHAQVTPGLEAGIKNAVDTLAKKHGTAGNSTLDVDQSAIAANDFIDLCTQNHFSEASQDYVASQKQLILDDPCFEKQLVDATKLRMKPGDAPDSYVAPEPTAERLKAERQELADNWTNNNSALRLVSPAISMYENGQAMKNKNWNVAAQVSQQVISKYDKAQLEVSDDKQAVANKVFTNENKEKVKAMHASVAGRQPDIPSMGLTAGSKVDQDARQEVREKLRPKVAHLKANIASSEQRIGEQKGLIEDLDRQMAELNEKRNAPKRLLQTESSRKKEVAQIDSALDGLQNQKNQRVKELGDMEKQLLDRQQKLRQAASGAIAPPTASNRDIVIGGNRPPRNEAPAVQNSNVQQAPAVEANNPLQAPEQAGPSQQNSRIAPAIAARMAKFEGAKEDEEPGKLTNSKKGGVIKTDEREPAAEKVGEWKAAVPSKKL